MEFGMNCCSLGGVDPLAGAQFEIDTFAQFLFALQLVKLIRPPRRVAPGFLSQSMQDCSRCSREVILLDPNDFFSHLLDVFGLW